MSNVKINDIAEALGLSRNTVSKVLNGKKMPEKTRKLVLDKASEMNYKQLSCDSIKQYRILLLSAKPLSNFNFFIPIIQAVENYCFERGHQLFQYVCVENQSDNNTLLDYIKKMNIDGIVCIETFSDSFIKTLLSYKIPTVFLDFSTNEDIEGNFDIIIQDNFSPIKKEMERLIKLGHTSFAFVGDINHCLSFKERYEAMLITLGINHIQHDASMDFIYDDEDEIYSNNSNLNREILRKKKLSEVYICANDFIARKFINALAKNGYNCPDKIKVIGYDNSSHSINMTPSITTVSVDRFDISRALLEVLFSRIKTPNKGKLKVITKSTLIQHRSTL